jgi:hypothetical protein
MAKRSYPLTKYVLQRRLDKTRGTPIVVLTANKTASTAIYHALFGLVPNSVLKTHTVRPDVLARAEQNYRKSAPDARPTHLFHGFYLSRHLPMPEEPWLIVTIVRDPIARAASEFFHSAERFGGIDASTILERFERFVRRNGIPRGVNWFDTEFEPTVGVDVYGHPFDRVNGYDVIEVEQARVLILRQESLAVAPLALARFLGLPGPVEVAVENDGSKKEYKDVYERVLREVRFSPETLDEAYCSRMVRHFYRPDEIGEFRRRWQQADGSL